MQNQPYEFKEKTWFLYPSDAFNSFGCIMSGELATIVAESNSWKTTFALDLIATNAEIGRKWFYINLEFPIETMWQSRWLWLHWKTKDNLTDLVSLTEAEKKDLTKYVNDMLKKFDYYNNPKGISLKDLDVLISEKALEWYKLFVIDSFSMIEWNQQNEARGNQNKCMQSLQELAQRLDIAIVVLHHTNRTGTWEGSQKIMDLSNVMIVISKEVDAEWEQYRNYALIKDKYVVNNEVDCYYRGWKYEKF